MRPNKNRRSKNQQSPSRRQIHVHQIYAHHHHSSRLLDDCEVITDLSAFENLSISTDFVNNNNYYYNNTSPMSFPYSVKQQCWEKAEKIKGRDPDRWRRDSIGNTVFGNLWGILAVCVMIMITFLPTRREDKAH